jgi:hypothetical protein
MVARRRSVRGAPPAAAVVVDEGVSRSGSVTLPLYTSYYCSSTSLQIC